jgi:hypothetical protein
MLATAAKARCTCACGAARVSGGRRQHIRAVNVNSEKVRKNVKLVGETSSRRLNADSETNHVREYGYHRQARPGVGAQRNAAGASDLRMLAQVEKWMAMIREIGREQQSQPAFPR